MAISATGVGRQTVSDDQETGGSAEPNQPADAADAKSGQDQGGDSPKDKAAQGGKDDAAQGWKDQAADERAQEQAREEAWFRNPNQSPFDDEEHPGAAEGASRAYREARGS